MSRSPAHLLSNILVQGQGCPTGSFLSHAACMYSDHCNIFPISFQVTLCSNTVQKYELALVVDVEGIGEEVLALLITAR